MVAPLGVASSGDSQSPTGPRESAKLAGVEPRAYLGEAARRAIRSAGAVSLARDLG